MFDAVIDEVNGRDIRIGDHWLTDFASCNYLGFDLDRDIIDAIDPAVRRWGVHPSWSRLLGNLRLYPELEERLAPLLGTEDVLLLPTITHIHLSVIPVLAGQGLICVERRAHRTIYDGCRVARGLGARVERFPDADLDVLDRLLRAAPRGPKLVCVDGVNSMTGDIADVPEYARVCREHGALLYIDDAHGFGVIGERRPDETSPYGMRGGGVLRHTGAVSGDGRAPDDIVLVGGMSKAYSSLLAFVGLPTRFKDHLKIAAAPYLYSGPSPVASLASAMAGLEVNEARGDTLRAHLYQLTARVGRHAEALGVVTLNRHGTPILEFPLDPRADLAVVAGVLWRRGVYVTLAPYPMVPREEVGFRVQLTASHTGEQTTRVTDALSELAGRGMLRRAR